MAALLKQFANTMIVLQHLVVQRAFLRCRPSTKQHLQDFQIVHLHVEEDLSLWNMHAILMKDQSWGRDTIPIAFPIRAGVWELVVRKLALGNLRRAAIFDRWNEARIEVQDHQIPKGIVARAAQVYSRAPLRIGSAAPIYISLLQNYPWHHVMKDVAESCAIQPPAGAIIDGWLCPFGASCEVLRGQLR